MCVCIYIYISVTVNSAHIDCAIATAFRQQKGQPGACQWSAAALYGCKMPLPRCALCLCLAMAIFSYVIEPHSPDPVHRSLGKGIPVSAGTPSQCHLGLFMLFFPSHMPTASQFHWICYFHGHTSKGQDLALISAICHFA